MFSQSLVRWPYFSLPRQCLFVIVTITPCFKLFLIVSTILKQAQVSVIGDETSVYPTGCNRNLPTGIWPYYNLQDIISVYLSGCSLNIPYGM